MAETGSRCWGRGQQDASESEADAGSRNPGSVTKGDGEGKPVKADRRHCDRQALCQSDGIAVWSPCCEHPCPLRRSAPALPKGEPWAKRQSFAECQGLPSLGEVAMRSIDGEVIPLFCKNPLQTSPRCGIIHLTASPLEIEYLPL